jgi:hypothetical protein
MPLTLLGGWPRRASLKKLAAYAKAHNIRIYLAMTPDVHDLKNYKFGWVHETMKRVAAEDGYVFVDLLPAFGSLPPEQVWAMPGDPHPNSLGHELMAKAISIPSCKTRPLRISRRPERVSELCYNDFQ